MDGYQMGKDMAALQGRITALSERLEVAERGVGDSSATITEFVKALEDEGLVEFPESGDTWILHPEVAKLIHKDDPEDED